MKNLPFFLLITLLIAPNTFAQQETDKIKKISEKIIDVRTDKEIKEYYTREELFMMGLQIISEEKKQELLEKAKKHKLEEEQRPKKHIPSYKDQILEIGNSIGGKLQWTTHCYRHPKFIGEFKQIITDRTKYTASNTHQLRTRAHKVHQYNIQLTAKGTQPISLQLQSKDDAIHFQNEIPENVELQPSENLSLQFDYSIPPHYKLAFITFQLSVTDTSFQIDIPIVTQGYDITHKDFVSYNQLPDAPIQINKWKTVHFYKENHESVFSLYPFDPSNKPTHFTFNQEPFFATEISRNNNQLDLSQIPDGIYLARIIDYMQRQQSFRVLQIQ